jgi:integrase
MSIRQKNGKWIVEIYEPAKGKTYVKPADFGMDSPKNERQAAKLERVALEARDKRRPGRGDETVGSFAARWMDDYAQGRGESTQVINRERVKSFGDEYAGRTLRSISRDEARRWAAKHAGTVPKLRTMFNDALNDELVDSNPFSRLGLAGSKGREGITVLTPVEVDLLAQCALDVHGPEFGAEMSSLIVWAAYTCMRPGESYAAKFSLLHGDTYDLRGQFNSRLGKETAPKHGGVGAIYVPEQAQRAVLGKARRLGDDLMFRGKQGQQMRGQSMPSWWDPVRAAFMARLPAGHHLHQRVALDPKDRLVLHELRHMGASYMLNDLGIEPWVVAKQLRHSDDGRLVIQLYGHPTRQTAIDKIRRAFTASAPASIESARERRTKEA